MKTLSISLGSKVTIRWEDKKFLRCYVTKVTHEFVQLYDPKRDYSWGCKIHEFKRVLLPLQLTAPF